MARGIFNSPVVGVVNRAFVGLMNLPGVGPIVRRGLVVIRYTGRRSGKTFETPVGYRRSGDTVTINIAAPEQKNWWRNFLGDGGPITLLNLDGRDRRGHAVAERNANGGVAVKVRLDD
ncbi:nitroreductase/quinone reductase family protein [Mycolicibacterium sp. 120270]|uniref:nitroreductase/quinone reductase family protein n=1 Tax=Mycolicibacterium sp. 120270 TaxID=3090600 RepID=UPI00299EF783|nr:nitroreductase/quinone reductase family protein [Mycolicibacterium sp. 120270]MDX1887560.1 nitroreductase/quinone reductase family protein [Mycolicibacterium sp. 120270]